MADQVANTVLGKLLDVVFNAVGRQISILYHYQDNIDKLKVELDDLNGNKERMDLKIIEARDKGDVIHGDVKSWIDSVKNITDEVQKFLQVEEVAANKAACFHLRSRLRSSKKAITKASEITELREKFRGFNLDQAVAHSAPRAGIEAYESVNIEDYDSQKKAMEAAIDALKDDSTHTISLCGPGGTGKTTVAVELGKKVQRRGSFHEVVMVSVSQPLNIDRIQDDIARFLGMDELPKDVSRREKLRSRLGDGRKVLLILDDVWSTFNLEKDLGIPVRKDSHSSGCKIVLTSRNDSVCRDMGAKRVIPVNPMSHEEAWKLFKQVVCEVYEGELNVGQIEGKIFKECGGLPVAILAIGNALRKEEKKNWEFIYQSLIHVSPADNEDIKDVYGALKTSYDFLTDKKAKACFLLCSLFPEDYDIPVERLAHYGMALEMFQPSPDTFIPARLAHAKLLAHRAVMALKHASLLLEGRDDDHVKMHDLIRDVAIAIASRVGDLSHKFLVQAGVRMTRWPNVNCLEEFTGISLMENKLTELPAEVECQRLQILLLEGNKSLQTIPSEYFQGMKNVKALNLIKCPIYSLPSSLSSLTTLHTLLLSGANIRDISSLEVMKKLEILDLSSTKIEHVPKQIGRLTNLRHLDIRECRKLRGFACGVISSLVQLEELYIGRSFFDKWEMGEEGKQTSNASLLELKSLTNLKILDIRIPHIPQDLVFEPVERFWITIGDSSAPRVDSVSRVLSLSGGCVDKNNSDTYVLKVLSCTKKLLNAVDCLVLDGQMRGDIYWPDWNIVVNPINADFSLLRVLRLCSCSGFSYLTDVAQAFCNLEKLVLDDVPELTKIYDDQLPITNGSFRKLKRLRIFKCPRLKSVFPRGFIKDLVHLEELVIQFCDSLEQVFEGEDMDITQAVGESSSHGRQKMTVLPYLERVDMRFLRSLKCFYLGRDSMVMEYPSLRSLAISCCEKIERWGYGIQLTPNLTKANITNYIPRVAVVELREDEDGTQLVVSNKHKQLTSSN